MRRYIINIINAIAGNVYSKKELQDKHSQIESETSRKYQTLIENLRSRIAEREEELKEVHTELSARIRALRESNERLMSENESVQSELGTLMKYRTLFEKTKSSLDLLCAAMADADAEKVRETVEQLDWNDNLTRIAHYYISTLDGAKVKV